MGRAHSDQCLVHFLASFVLTHLLFTTTPQKIDTIIVLMLQERLINPVDLVGKDRGGQKAAEVAQN